jgi:hypothetical protein
VTTFGAFFKLWQFTFSIHCYFIRVVHQSFNALLNWLCTLLIFYIALYWIFQVNLIDLIIVVLFRIKYNLSIIVNDIQTIVIFIFQREQSRVPNLVAILVILLMNLLVLIIENIHRADRTIKLILKLINLINCFLLIDLGITIRFLVWIYLDNLIGMFLLSLLLFISQVGTERNDQAYHQWDDDGQDHVVCGIIALKHDSSALEFIGIRIHSVCNRAIFYDLDGCGRLSGCLSWRADDN